MFNETNEGKTNYCETCESEARGLHPDKFSHTCGLTQKIKTENMRNIDKETIKRLRPNWDIDQLEAEISQLNATTPAKECKQEVNFPSVWQNKPDGSPLDPVISSEKECKHEWHWSEKMVEACSECGIEKDEIVSAKVDQDRGWVDAFVDNFVEVIYGTKDHADFVNSPTGLRERKPQEIIDFIKSTLLQQQTNLSVSEWARIGHERTYWDYFRDLIRCEFQSKLQKEIEGLRKDEVCPKYPNGNGYCNQKECNFCRNKESEFRDGFNQALDQVLEIIKK